MPLTYATQQGKNITPSDIKRYLCFWLSLVLYKWTNLCSRRHYAGAVKDEIWVLHRWLGWQCVNFSPHSLPLNLVLSHDDATTNNRARYIQQRSSYITEWISLWQFVDIDECIQGSHDCLSNLANCTNTVGSYNCSCYLGYKGDGKTSCVVPPGKDNLNSSWIHLGKYSVGTSREKMTSLSINRNWVSGIKHCMIDH